MRIIENDDDMKIAGSEKKAPVDVTEQWVAQKKSGNIDRAHRLGKVLAQQLMNLQAESDALLLQQQMLFAFTMDTVGPALLADDILVETARGTFFERLRALLPTFETTLHRLGAFTFYRLCVDGYHPRALPAQKIGAMYAALCGKAEDAEFAAEGAELFQSFVARLQETMDMVEFERV